MLFNIIIKINLKVFEILQQEGILLKSLVKIFAIHIAVYSYSLSEESIVRTECFLWGAGNTLMLPIGLRQYKALIKLIPAPIGRCSELLTDPKLNHCFITVPIKLSYLHIMSFFSLFKRIFKHCCNIFKVSNYQRIR